MGAADGTRASPFRAANYELVLQLATAHAVECLLRRDRVDTTLAERWRENKERFYGHNQWTRGDSGRRSLTDRFISSLVLANNPRGSLFKTNSKSARRVSTFRAQATKPSADGEGLVCPADEVLAARVDVARDFADALTLAPDEHLRWSAWKLEASLA